MVTRKAFDIALILLFGFILFATGARTGVICCEEGWVNCCNQDFQQENTAMLSPLKHCPGFPAKCCDIEKCMDFGMPDAFISTVRANDHSFAAIAAVSTDELSENSVNVGLGEQYHEPGSPATSIYLQTLSFLC